MSGPLSPTMGPVIMSGPDSACQVTVKPEVTSGPVAIPRVVADTVPGVHAGSRPRTLVV